MADRRGGLGESGLNRIRGNIGGNVGGQDVTAYERQMYGSGRAAPPRGRTAWEYPESSRVRAYSYDLESQTLMVRFIKYNTPWVYHDVPTPVFEAFDASDSKGRYINSTLNYTSYRRATPQEEADWFTDGYGPDDT